MAGTPSTGNPTNTFAIDNTQRYLVIVQQRCMRVFVQENYNSASAPVCDLLKSASSPRGYQGTETQIAVPKGTPAIYTPPNGREWWEAGETAGDIETASGSCTVQQDESQQV